MPKYNDGFHADRRRGPDFCVRTARILVWFVWPLLFAAFIVIGYAKPQMETFFDRMFHVQLRTWWDQTLLHWFLGLMVGGFLLSILGMLLFAIRNRRRTDRIPVSLIVLFFASLAGVAIYLLLQL